MVITTTSNILVNNNNVKHYNKKGYKCISGDTINVKWNDTPSYYNIECKCDKCLIFYTLKKSTLTTQKHPGLCKSCSSQQSKYSTLNDLSGQKFKKLIVVELYNNIPGGEKYWKCLCDCGNIKITSGRSLKNNKTTSCGCYYKEVVKNIIVPKLIKSNKTRIGEKHPNWDPTKSNKERFTLRKYEMSVLREQTFKRDNHTCQCCFNRGGKILNAHHIIPFSQNVELRYNIDNLITLCYECHKQYHSKYKKNINQETLNEYRKEINFVV
jgi:hypothetical protein